MPKKVKREPSMTAMINALQSSYGNVSAAARSLEIDPRSLRRRISGNAKLEQARDDARDLFLDDLQSVNQKAALEPKNTVERIFTLKTLGKSRGYVERQEVTGAGGGPIELKWPEDE